jgi:uncharacterized spore protein YtfJ
MELEELLDKVSESVQAGRSFGPAAEHGDVTLVPVALVIGGGGGGSGSGPGEDDPGGSGGGFGTISWPLGAYAIKDGNVRWVPALDVTRVAIAGIGAAKLLIKLRRRRRDAVNR